MISFRAFITRMQPVLSPKGLEMSSKPPLGSGLGILCASKLWVVSTIIIPPKVVFTWHCARARRLKLTVSGWTVNMQALITKLPKRDRQILAYVSPDVDVFHFLALASPNIINDFEVLEVSTEVVSEIDAVGRIAACCSPVGRASQQWSHSGLTQSVLIPVLGVLVHWCVYLEGRSTEFWKTSIKTYNEDLLLTLEYSQINMRKSQKDFFCKKINIFFVDKFRVKKFVPFCV